MKHYPNWDSYKENVISYVQTALINFCFGLKRQFKECLRTSLEEKLYKVNLIIIWADLEGLCILASPTYNPDPDTLQWIVSNSSSFECPNLSCKKWDHNWDLQHNFGLQDWERLQALQGIQPFQRYPWSEIDFIWLLNQTKPATQGKLVIFYSHSGLVSFFSRHEIFVESYIFLNEF